MKTLLVLCLAVVGFAGFANAEEVVVVHHHRQHYVRHYHHHYNRHQHVTVVHEG